MQGWKNTVLGAEVVAAITGAAVTVGLATLALYFLPGPSPTPEPMPVAAPPKIAQQAPKAALPSTAKDIAAPRAMDPVAKAPSPLQPPRFDLVRVEQDGSALVAGQAMPNSGVLVVVDAKVVATATADRSGGFAALFELAYSSQPRLVTLRLRLPDGQEIVSKEQVILAPGDIAPPTAVADDRQGGAPVLAADADVIVPQTDAVAVAAALPDDASAVTTEPKLENLAPVAILLAPTGVRVLQKDGTQNQSNLRPVVIDAISYVASGAVQLGGRAMAGSVVRLYLDGVSLADFSVAEDGGWGGVLPDVAPGRYTLRADQLDATGKVTARFETPFQRETQESLAALLLPAANPAPQNLSAPTTYAITPDAAQMVPAVSAITQAPTQRLGSSISAGPDPMPNSAAQPQVGSTSGPAMQPQPATTATDVAPDLGADASLPVPGLSAPAAIAQNSATPVSPVIAPQDRAAVAPVSVTVQPGFTLWAIARDQFGDGVLYVQVYEANKDRIRNPDLIYPGQVFALPSPKNAGEAAR